MRYRDSLTAHTSPYGPVPADFATESVQVGEDGRLRNPAMP
jgi:hypothetical protein